MRLLVRLGFFAAALALAAVCSYAAENPPAAAPDQASKPDPATKWESQVQAHEKATADSPPQEGGILFIGSSTIRMWKTLAEDFAPQKVVGRGVGGCQVSDMVYYAERLVLPMKPRQIVFYAGDNDIQSRKTPEQVLADYQAFVAKVRKALPQTIIHFIAIKPSPSRTKVWPEAKKANDLVRKWCEATPSLGYIDTAASLLDAEGNPRPEFFLKDMLHMNPQGYEQWIPIIKAAIGKADAKADVKPATAAP